MKVYVDELPKSCKDCPCCSSDQYCNHLWKEYTDSEKPYFNECNLKDYFRIPYDFKGDAKKYKEWLDSLPKNNYEQYKTCPLQSLSDYTKQVRKEVCEKFVEQFMLEYTMGNKPVEDIIYKVADQIQGVDNA